MTPAETTTTEADGLLVIDMQNCFLDSGPLARERERLVQRCNVLIANALAASAPVFTIRTEHRRDRSTWTRNMVADDQGFAFSGDDDARLVAGLTVNGSLQLTKTRDSAFLYTDLEERLRAAGVAQFALCGVSTHGCIAATAAEAYARDFGVLLVHDAIASHVPQVHPLVLNLLQDEYRQPVLAADEVRFGSGGAVRSRLAMFGDSSRRAPEPG